MIQKGFLLVGQKKSGNKYGIGLARTEDEYLKFLTGSNPDDLEYVVVYPLSKEDNRQVLIYKITG